MSVKVLEASVVAESVAVTTSVESTLVAEASSVVVTSADELA